MYIEVVGNKRELSPTYTNKEINFMAKKKTSKKSTRKTAKRSTAKRTTAKRKTVRRSKKAAAR